MPTSPWLIALKLFLPSWDFFNDFTAVPAMELSVIRADGTDPGWQPAFPPNVALPWWRVLFNAQGNRDLLEQSIVERAAEELSEQLPATFPGPDPTVDRLVRLARNRARQTGLPMESGFRFRLVLREPGLAEQVLFVSPPLEGAARS